MAMLILTARILGFELGIARVIGAVSFSIIIGLIMAFIYRKEEREKEKQNFGYHHLNDADDFTNHQSLAPETCH